MKTLEGSVHGDLRDDYYKHEFINGLYVRTIYAPKGWLAVTMIHKKPSPYFFMKGKVSMFTEEGETILEAPMRGMSQVGTCRLFFEKNITLTFFCNLI